MKLHTHPTRMRFALLCAALLILVGQPLVLYAQTGTQADATVRLKDLVDIQGATASQLTGYGIVVGLDRTGDKARGVRGSPYTVQSIANMLQRFGVTVDPALLSARNTAAVMITSQLSPFQGQGGKIDVTISSLGDAKSLSGGVLLQTPLIDVASGVVYAMAQGPVSTGAVSAGGGGSSVKVNHSTTGRIPGGAIVTAHRTNSLVDVDTLGLSLRKPDFTNAVRIATAINESLPGSATVMHAGLVSIVRPQTTPGSELMASIEPITILVDVPARIVINERTGTIVSGGNVRISEVMVTYGSVVVTTQTQPAISQPQPFSQGETIATTVGETDVNQDQVQSVVLNPNVDVNELAAALNSLGMTARDIIAIFQAIDRAGALQGELVIV